MGLIRLVYLALVVYSWMIVARALFSWFPVKPGSGAYGVQRFLVRVTEPYLSIFRRILPVTRVGGVGIDWSALIGLVVILLFLQVVGRL